MEIIFFILTKSASIMIMIMMFCGGFSMSLITIFLRSFTFHKPDFKWSCWIVIDLFLIFKDWQTIIVQIYAIKFIL